MSTEALACCISTSFGHLTLCGQSLEAAAGDKTAGSRARLGKVNTFRAHHEEVVFGSQRALQRKKEPEMNFSKAAPAVLCAAVIAAAFSPSLKADDWNQKTVITFSQPVETPGVHMRDGRYCGQAPMFSGFWARLSSPGNQQNRAGLRETPPGEPGAWRAWFYPGKPRSWQ